jgi:hypothetical protein
MGWKFRFPISEPLFNTDQVSPNDGICSTSSFYKRLDFR